MNFHLYEVKKKHIIFHDMMVYVYNFFEGRWCTYLCLSIEEKISYVSLMFKQIIIVKFKRITIVAFIPLTLYLLKQNINLLWHLWIELNLKET